MMVAANGFYMEIWQRWIINPTEAEDLSVDARMVLGILGACDISHPRDVAQAMLAKQRHVAGLISRLKKCRHKVVKNALKQGLPIDAAVAVYQTGRKLYCKKCRGRLSHVPCLRCACRQLAENGDEENAGPLETFELPQSRTPTRARPGSLDKIRIMRKRAELGVSVFCDDDMPMKQ